MSEPVTPDEIDLVGADLVIKSRKHWYFRQMMAEPDVAKKIKYMNGLIGKGATSCRHRPFTAEPAIVEEEILNPCFRYKVVAMGIAIKLFTKEHPKDFAICIRPSSTALILPS